MSKISETIANLNSQNKKALSVFLTAGFPDEKSFVELACDIYDAGANLIELGIPFSDPLADGPVIQQSSQQALENGMTLKKCLDLAAQIKSKVDKPLILMGYSNPLIRFGLNEFTKAAKSSGVDGLIIPDIPLEEYEDFFTQDFNGLDTILLTTPTSSEERISNIDKLSSGFVYCVSVTGTTGVRQNFEGTVKENLKRTYNIIKKNKMMIGFGISSPENIESFYDISDGFIVGSAVIKSLLNETREKTFELVSSLAHACH